MLTNNFGVSLSAVGDFNQDGFIDVSLGASRDISYGSVYIVNLRTNEIIRQEACDMGTRCSDYLDPQGRHLNACITDADCSI